MATSPVWSIECKGSVKIPILGLGTYAAVGDDLKEIIFKAIDVGYRHFDTADYYDVIFIIQKKTCLVNVDSIFCLSITESRTIRRSCEKINC